MSGLAKRLPSGMASTRDASPPVVPDAGPRRAPVVITSTGSAPGIDRAAAWSRPLPRTRLLPELTADGFCPGSASRSRSDTEGALDRFWLA